MRIPTPRNIERFTLYPRCVSSILASAHRSGEGSRNNFGVRDEFPVACNRGAIFWPHKAAASAPLQNQHWLESNRPGHSVFEFEVRPNIFTGGSMLFEDGQRWERCWR